MSSPEFIAEVISIHEDFWHASSLITKLLENQGSRRTLSEYLSLPVSRIGHETNSRSRFDELTCLDETFRDDYLIVLFDDVFEGEWPRENVLEWARVRHCIPANNHPSFRGNDGELAILLPGIRNFETFVSPELLCDKIFMGEAMEECPSSLPRLPESMKCDFNVLVGAMNCGSSIDDLHYCGYLLYEGEEWKKFVGFDDRLYCFGQDLREVLARPDGFDAFLDASNKLCRLGLDDDTTTALTQKISSFVGAPLLKNLFVFVLHSPRRRIWATNTACQKE